ncbi:hypothetical protein JQ616_00930 [Bradyrhizobium tropiciagri]|uniref:hypothetical protein n=1 Tax=Bradyrhizobium tropiciagri TaxID=312253 RepID=UPI001BA877F6|nr:hypothetical protein [Bradyrhizobium tropiciagri]MBR0893495.1 hypothetical protein [Bradyrhizobium tropiciagri]
MNKTARMAARAEPARLCLLVATGARAVHASRAEMLPCSASLGGMCPCLYASGVITPSDDVTAGVPVGLPFACASAAANDSRAVSASAFRFGIKTRKGRKC